MKYLLSSVPFLSVSKGTYYKKSYIVLLGLWIGCLPILEAQQKDYFTSNNRAVNIEGFNKEVKDMMQDLGIPGMSLAIIEDNKIAFYQTYGIKELGETEKVNANTVFSGASLSKSFFLFVAHQLVDEGKLELDTPMYTYMEYPRLAHDPRYKLITPRMILSHSSGIENWQWMNDVGKLEILTPPGSNEYVYSGEAYNYLALVVKKILNQGYESYIKERVLTPLNLKNTYLKYEEIESDSVSKTIPENYATGHGIFGSHKGYKNYSPVPSSGIHFTAEDYAKLIIATFDTTYLSAQRIKAFNKPIAKVEEQFYYGLGYELIFSEKDTVIAQGGNNDGYKNWIFYSTVNKRGIVFLMNADHGELMTVKLNELSVQLNLNGLLDGWYSFKDQYPSTATRLFSLYKEKDEEIMFTEIEKLQAENKLKTSSLLTLYTLFSRGGKDDISKKLLDISIALDPESFPTYLRLGNRSYEAKDYDTALGYFLKAKKNGYLGWSNNAMIENCRAEIADKKRRDSFCHKLSKSGEALLHAGAYSFAEGNISTFSEVPDEIDKRVSFFSKGDELNYKLKLTEASTFKVSIRVASAHKASKNQLHFRIGDEILAKLDIPQTDTWEEYITETVELSLKKGEQILNLHLDSGDINLKWIKFAPIEHVID